MTETDAALLAECQEEIAELIGITVPSEDLSKLLAPEQSLLGAAREWGVHDTVVRGQLVDVITRDLVGAKWPTYGDTRNGVDLDAFIGQANAAALERGWAVSS